MHTLCCVTGAVGTGPRIGACAVLHCFVPWSLGMFRCFSLLGIVAVAFGVAALASASPPAKKITVSDKNRRPQPRPTYTRIPGLKYHLAFSMN
jgi:hypothetical protein